MVSKLFKFNKNKKPLNLRIEVKTNDYKIYNTKQFNWRCDVFEERDFDRFLIFSASGNSPEEALSNALNLKNGIKE